MSRIRIPMIFAHFDVLPENDPRHPESDVRYDIPNRVIYINLAAKENANVTRVRFSDRVELDWRR